MGVKTRDEFVQELIDRVGIGTNHSVYTPARIGRMFYYTYLHVTMPNVYKHPEMEVTEYKALSATSLYTLANEYRQVYSVALVYEAYTTTPAETSRRIALRQRNARYFDNYTKQTRQPTLYVHWARRLELDAVPNSDWATRMLQVRGYIKPDDIAATETTLISEDWDEVIDAGMLHRFYLAADMEDKIETSREDYARLINERGGFLIQSGDDLDPAMEMESGTIDWRNTNH